MRSDDPVRREREEAWIGDSVLGLYARKWILESTGRMDAEMFAAMTSNQFLSTIGNPTSVEARIGREYAESGLAAAFALIEREILPRFASQQRRRHPMPGRGAGKK
jgi:hypothetical protein